MKRYILLFLFVAVTLMSCDPIEWMDYHGGKWYLKNNTDRTLDVSSSYTSEGCLGRHYVNEKHLAPGDSVVIYSVGYALIYNIIPDWLEFSRADSIFVKESNVELCRWLRDEPVEGRRNIFDESLWRFYKEVKDIDKYSRHRLTWVFDLTESDLNDNSEDVQQKKGS